MLETYTQTMNGLSLDMSNFQFCLPVYFLLLLIKQGEMPMLFHKSGVYISLKKSTGQREHPFVTTTATLLSPSILKKGAQKVVKPFLSVLNELEATIRNQALYS